MINLLIKFLVTYKDKQNVKYIRVMDAKSFMYEKII